MMKADEKQEIVKRITGARAKLLAVVEGLEAAGWEWRPGDGRWSVRLTLAHVGEAQRSHLEAARRAIAGEPIDLPDFDLEAWNAAAVAKRDAWPVERVLADLDAAQDATLAFLEELDAEQLAVTESHPALGEMSVGKALRIIAVHDSMHRRDISKLLDEMGETPQGAETGEG
jgi:uncharacterized damage-inducible protein DinB